MLAQKEKNQFNGVCNTNGNTNLQGNAFFFCRVVYLDYTICKARITLLVLKLSDFQVGKRKEYSIGEALRQRYGSFFGEYYYPDLVESWSTDYNRTKMSLDLVHASLFQPRGMEKWKIGLNWQPVPYNFLPTNKDKVSLF